MISDSGVKDEGRLGKPDRRRLIPSSNDPIHTTKDIMISMEKHFAVTRGMDNKVKVFVAQPWRLPMANKILGKQLRRHAGGRGASEVSDGEESLPAEITACYQDGYPRDDVPRALRLLDSSHRDGSIYRDNCHWKQEYRIADRNESE
ncbi:hypothetical protein BAE44_0021707 [Dichanthelium oligosanthes]|uniref:Uncharacterized protein n=1 Tax=Dichanthelium oligosanthes TaxID=888268 RepID=A0A1E5UWX5_9POAL|nr:hypothetical protein BAE44_0021707 [Dichanthelium oligosanthes]